MKLKMAWISLGIYFLRVAGAFGAELGDQTGHSPALSVGDANATQLTDIHDIKPALSPGFDIRWLYWALSIAVVLILAAFAWRLWQRHKKPAPGEIAPTPIPAETEAFRMLDTLAAEPNLNPKQFYFRLSAILRCYIERRYQIPAAEMTTEELLPKVDRLPLGTGLSQPLKAFCRSADPIKFAGAGADPTRMARDLSFARDFVRQTTEMLKTTEENEIDSPGLAASQKPAQGQIALNRASD